MATSGGTVAAPARPADMPTGPVEQALWRAAKLPRIPTDEATVQAFVDEMKACETEAAFAGLCERIDASVHLCYEVESKVKILRAFFDSKSRLKLGFFGVGKDTDKKLDDACKAYLAQEVHLAFQPPPPVPFPNAKPVQLTFVDVTALHRQFGEDDVWAPEMLEAGMDEPWDDVFFRLRALANRKYRHPYLPTVALYVLRSGQEVRIGRTELAYTVARHLAAQGGSTEVRYLHADDDHHTAQSAWSHSPEMRKPSPWDRVLPEWFHTPDTWVDTVPPASCSLPERRIEGFWLPVPTLCFPTSPRMPLPGTSTPDLIAKTTYVPARTWPNSPEPSPSVIVQQEEDVCLPSDRLVPPLTVEQATSLLGRMIQWSDLEPGQEKHKTKYQSRELAYAFALDTRTMRLYVRNPHGQHGSAYTLDVSETAQSVHTRPWEPERSAAPRVRKEFYAKGVWDVRARVCMWLGPVTLPADRDALGVRTGGSEDKARREAAQKAAYDAFFTRLRGAIAALNPPTRAEGQGAPFEVGKDGTLLVGDIAACASMNDFTSIKHVRPGVWKSWFTMLPADSAHAAQWAGSVEAVHLQFLSDPPGSVDYLRPPEHPQASEEAVQLARELDGKQWERLCVFSVDAGTCGILARSALGKGGFLRSKLVELETVLETLAEGGSEASLHLRATAVPGGVVCPAGPGDGAYDVLGKRDGEGRVVRVMCDFWRDWMKEQGGRDANEADGDDDAGEEEDGEEE
ncbi:hypothetical protein CALCODRAFT_487457 [Calocera cornea HHB12733]|uniref:Uncharacterized protein n=1 Tax=Calocera cornea HHB12733 TaxID=1353952 RepID=A0A165D460_9BASI|nr:hypothetical protein CALCODRAFT_487457 [Calocera cornea HHB12733]